MDKFAKEAKKKSITTSCGTFEAQVYEVIQNSSQVGARISLTFTPGVSVADQPIGLIQTTQISRSEATLTEQYEDEPFKLKRMTKKGTHIDQSTYVDPKGNVVSEGEKKATSIPQTNPVYNATNRKDLSATKLSQGTETNQFGSIHSPSGTDPARIIDAPSRFILHDETIHHAFETTALTLTSPVRYLGSVTWGYTAVASDGLKNIKVDLHPFVKSSDDLPSEEFLMAANLWNEQTVADPSSDKQIARVQIPLKSSK
jgi:hypothetical protein